MNDFSIDITAEAKEFRGSEFTLLSPGWYTTTIIEAELVNTASGNGQMIVLKYENGIKDRLNVFHSNEKAQQIGRQTLAKICESVGLNGKFTLKDMKKLFGRKLDVKVTVEPFKGKDGNTKQGNVVKNYATAGSKAGETTSAEIPQEPTHDKAPWE